MRLSLVVLVLAALSGLVINFNRPIGHFLDRWGRWHPFEGGVEINGIPVLLYANVPSVSPFMATVLSKSVEEPVVHSQNANSTTAVGSAQSAWVEIRLKKADGSQLAIVSANPDSNVLAFANFLRDGTSYEFPLVLTQWQQNR